MSQLQSEREIATLPCHSWLSLASNHLKVVFHTLQTPSENPPFATAVHLFGCAFGIWLAY